MSEATQNECPNERLVIGFCPQCKQETLKITVENAGKGFNHTFEQTEYWFEGTGKCECGYEAYYSDSSL